MSGVYQVEIAKSETDLKHLLRIQKTASDKERLQLLYLLTTQQAKTVQAAASLLSRHRVAVQKWLGLYRKGGLAGLLEHTPHTGRKPSIPAWAQESLRQRLQDSEGFNGSKPPQKSRVQ
jgi:transposase